MQARIGHLLPQFLALLWKLGENFLDCHLFGNFIFHTLPMYIYFLQLVLLNI